MRRLNILVVDDDPRIRQSALAAFDRVAAQVPDVEIAPTVVGDADEARASLEVTYFHLGFFDLDLGVGRGQLGAQLIGEVARARPSCSAVLLTKHPTGPEYRQAFFAPLFPFPSSVQGAVSKPFARDDLFRAVMRFLRRWRGGSIHIVDLSVRYAEIRRRVASTDQGASTEDVEPESQDEDRPEVAGSDEFDGDNRDLGSPETPAASSIPLFTVDELNEVLRKLFTGMGTNRAEGVRVFMDPLKIDRGRSAVYRVVPFFELLSGSWVGGHEAIVKVAGRRDIRLEVQNYGDFVQFGVSGRHRPELMGHSLGDTIGAACYSIVGAESVTPTVVRREPQRADVPPPVAVRTLETILRGPPVERQDIDRAVKLFDPTESSWYSLQRSGSNLLEWFSRRIGFDPDLAVATQRDFLSSNLGALGGRVVDKKSGRYIQFDEFGKELLPVFSDDTFASGFDTDFFECLVHGDLHAGNIVIPEYGPVGLIDYRHTQFGPRLFDFVALDCSFRVFSPGVPATAPGDAVRSMVVGGLVRESVVDKEVVGGAPCWEGSPTSQQTWDSQIVELWNAGPGGDRDLPAWAYASMRIQNAARANFEDCTLSEYLRLAILYGAALLTGKRIRSGSIDKYGKLRVVLWLARVLSRLEVCEGDPVAPDV